MKKSIVLLTIVTLLFTLILCGCENKNEEPIEEGELLEEETQIERKEVSEETLNKLVVSLNEANFKIGDKIEDVKDKLGEEVHPSQKYTPCGGNNDDLVNSYYFDGIMIETTSDGIIFRAVISGNDYPNSKATIAGIKIGATPNEVRDTFEEVVPDTDSEYTISYMFGDYLGSFALDFEGTGNVNYISLEDMTIAGV